MSVGRLAKPDLHLLSVFVNVVEAGGFSAAQVALNVSASTISRQMSNLETRLDIRLCERGRGGFRLTNRGTTVYRAAKALFASMEEFRGTVEATRGQLTGQLSLAVVENWVADARSPLVETLAEFKVLAPEARVEIHSLASDDIEHAVLDGRMALGIGVFHQHRPGLDYQRICDDPVELFCGFAHPLFGRKTLAARSVDLSTLDMVRRAYLSEEQVAPETAHIPSTASAHQVEGVAFMILTGAHVGYLPVQYAAHWVRDGRMRSLCPETFRLQTQIEVATRRGRKQPLLTEKFLQLLMAQAALQDRGSERR